MICGKTAFVIMINIKELQLENGVVSRVPALQWNPFLAINKSIP